VIPVERRSGAQSGGARFSDGTSEVT